MSKYLVNDNAQPTGEHEVHEDGCVWLLLTHSATPLGEHSSCRTAVQAASRIYSNVDGCATCSPFCHLK